MSARDHSDVWVCHDCYIAHHYGSHEHEGGWFAGDSDTPTDREPLARLADLEITDNVCSNHEVGQGIDPDGEDIRIPCIHCGSDDFDDGEHEFSWSSCDGCGSSLGGSRYRLAVWH